MSEILSLTFGLMLTFQMLVGDSTLQEISSNFMAGTKIILAEMWNYPPHWDREADQGKALCIIASPVIVFEFDVSHKEFHLVAIYRDNIWPQQMLR